MITKPTIYTEEYALKELKQFLKDIKENKDIIFKGEWLENRKYSRFELSKWIRKYKDNIKIKHTIKKIEDILETRNYVYAAQKKIHPILAIFNLKNNYGWKDQRDLDVKSGGKRITGFDFVKPKD